MSYSLTTPGLWAGLEDWVHRACVDAVVAEMQAQGYAARSIFRFVQNARAFVAWRDGALGAATIDHADFGRFVDHRREGGQLKNGDRKGLARLRQKMVMAEVLTTPLAPSGPVHDLVARFEADLTRRGYRSASVRSYTFFCRPFLIELWSDGAELTKAGVLDYLERHAGDRGRTTAAIMCSRLRGLLRFMRAKGLIAEDLALAVPSARAYRLTGLPAYLPPMEVDAILAACDRTTAVGKRDHAVLSLLARLGLRAAEVALLTLDDVDWRAGALRIDGKGGRVAQMPMPQDVGEALADYIRHGRPPTTSRTIFHRVETPCLPFTAATPVILIARRALHRSGLHGKVRGASHVFRHSLATHMIRSGASLNEIGQVLRHQAPDTARIYAKVDVACLRSLSLAWPGGAQ
ncbi:MAG: tyrosine-type recombinase/integrase [Proteobacteria bacterium]|nr:tyrosine-type recombinase/integrase [Pseudomonadota bacterium]